jgi:hypothetical protein
MDAAKAFCTVANEGIRDKTRFLKLQKLLKINELQIAMPWNTDIIKFPATALSAKPLFEAIFRCI